MPLVGEGALVAAERAKTRSCRWSAHATPLVGGQPSLLRQGKWPSELLLGSVIAA
jgi:hypothetical protein